MFGMDRRTDRQMDTSSPLPVHFRFTSGPFGHHGWSYEASQLMFTKKNEIPKICGRKKKVTPKDPFRINIRDLKNYLLANSPCYSVI